MYGSCSNQAIQTGKAWYAVGVGTGFHSNTVCGSIATVLFPATYTGIEQLNAAGSCTNTVTPLVGSVTFRSAEIVRLRPGFTAVGSSSPFVAQITDCSYTVWKPAPAQDGIATHPDQHWDENQETLSAAELSYMRIVPNPASDQVQVIFPMAADGVHLRIFDMAGRVILDQQNLTQERSEVNLTGWPSGIYLVEIESSLGLEQRRLMVE